MRLLDYMDETWLQDSDCLLYLCSDRGVGEQWQRFARRQLCADMLAQQCDDGFLNSQIRSQYHINPSSQRRSSDV